MPNMSLPHGPRGSDWRSGDTILFQQNGLIERGTIGWIIRPGPDNAAAQDYHPLQYSVRTDLGFSRMVPAHNILALTG